jgi:hypothetical protein
VGTSCAVGLLASLALIAALYAGLVPKSFSTMAYVAAGLFWLGSQVAGVMSTSGAFEIVETRGGKSRVIFSKLQSGRYPASVNAIVESVRREW